MKEIKLNLPSITICCHLFYENTWEILNPVLTNFKTHISNQFINISNDCSRKKEIVQKIKYDFPNSKIITTPNNGKDLGGKLALIDLSLKLNLDANYYIFLHDKKSPHSPLGETWRKNLFKIIDPENIPSVLELFEKNKQIGIVAAKEYITNEYDENTRNFNCMHNSILKKLIVDYSLKLNTHDFVGGTMFWIRAEIVHSFFKKNDPLEIRSTLEKGNVLDHEQGTLTHSWERMLSWIAIDQGYYIKGI